MQIYRATVLGMCFGVRDALQVLRHVAEPETVTIHGELVHNEVVLTQLRVRGFEMVSEDDREAIATTPRVLITAHGVSDRERGRLLAAGKELIDTTCPLVTRVHAAAQRLEAGGYHVLVIGRPGHVEVNGIVEDLRSCDVIPSVGAVRRYGQARLGVVCQSTTPPPLAAEILAEIVRQNPAAEVKSVDTICRPTRDHQRSLNELLVRVDAVVVVGGRNSNNTRELANRARERGLPAYHVSGPQELRAEWFEAVERVGLTAGTSTLEETIDAVEDRLNDFAAASSTPGPHGRSRQTPAHTLR